MNRKPTLPHTITVEVMREKSGVYFAELPKYDSFTEANSFEELVFNINDLIYTLFDVPTKDRNKFWYSPSKKPSKQKKLPVSPVLFKVLIDPQSRHSFS